MVQIDWQGRFMKCGLGLMESLIWFIWTLRAIICLRTFKPTSRIIRFLFCIVQLKLISSWSCKSLLRGMAQRLWQTAWNRPPTAWGNYQVVLLSERRSTYRKSGFSPAPWFLGMNPRHAACWQMLMSNVTWSPSVLCRSFIRREGAYERRSIQSLPWRTCWRCLASCGCLQK